MEQNIALELKNITKTFGKAEKEKYFPFSEKTAAEKQRL